MHLMQLMAAVEVGDYINLWKLLPVLILLIIWARLLTWMDKDAIDAHLPAAIAEQRHDRRCWRWGCWCSCSCRRTWWRWRCSCLRLCWIWRSIWCCDIRRWGLGI